MQQERRNRDSQFLYVSLSVLPVILGEMVVIWQVGLSLYSALTGVVCLFCAIGCGLFLWHRHVDELAQVNSRWQQDETHKINAVAAYNSELERLLLTIGPILSQQVMASREHTEQEIISLANRFSNMVDGLQQIVDSTGSVLDETRNYHLDNVIANSRDLLKPVLESLTSIQQVEHDAIGELKNLSTHVSGLDSIAAEVNGLTRQINLLVLSATKEAGEQGFIIGVDSAHKLAEDASRIDNRLTLKVAALNAALKKSESSVRVDDSKLFQAEANINQTLSIVAQTLTHYRGDVEALRNNAEQIRGEINNVLVALQFQDRVSQILTQVENNLLNLQKTIEKIQQQGSNRDSNMLQVDEAVEYIEENYKSVSSKPNSMADDGNDLTFF